VHLGDTAYGFNDPNYNKLKQWESVLFNNEVLSICRQIGIIDEYIQKLYGNSFHEIDSYEILRYVLQNGRRRPLNFQMLNGTGGIKWLYKHFFAIDLDGLPQEMKVLKECFQKRHQIIRGELDDTAITKESVSEFHATVRKVISYIRDEIMTWNWIL
jgi:hypothetical protein